MAYPNDLSDVTVFKIHPAIGIARLAQNDDYFVFGADPGTYKSNKKMKRQAVQFRIFAYGANHVGLGELTAETMQNLQITPTWTATVANRKLARLLGNAPGTTENVIAASASAQPYETKALTGSLPDFSNASAIPLGEITGAGLFIPAKGGIFRRTAEAQIENYEALSTDVADTTCDGSISVKLVKDGQALDVLPACILVAPQDFSPDVNEARTLDDHLRQKLHIPQGPAPQNPHNAAAEELDRAALRPATAIFDPGVEIGLQPDRTEVETLGAAFFSATTDPRIDPREVRVRYRAGAGGEGVVPGQLTSGLCSTWQGDYQACIGFWTSTLPDTVALEEDPSVEVQAFRKQFADHSPGAVTLSVSGEAVEAGIDKMGVFRKRDGKLVETERGPGDDA
ncbi:MAG TPA: LodA/GoxA family CTQ-dependent oxidase [Chthoniobacteraceae bacterium]|jgi:hypothetical protein|nr:LodA/GoxA family CTQ-dependent oxidase [Chthoniobacteraceae bacterium]